MDLATKVCSLMGVFALVQTLVPPRLRQLSDRWVENWWDWIFKTSDPFTYLEVPENQDGGGFTVNFFYHDLGLYLGSLENALATLRVNVHRDDENSRLTFSLPVNEMLEDSFRGRQLWWSHSSTKKGDSLSSNEQRGFSLKMYKSDRALLLSDYFDHITKTAAEVERLNTERHLYTNRHGQWEQVAFKHPSSFDTLALEPDLKDRIKADLEAFSTGKDFYHGVGRAWKRGYLLYGPPGTGKSSMIAAMANFLHYDIYDLELTKVHDNSYLKSLLIKTTKKSIIVIEDIDCSLDLSDRSPTVDSYSEGIHSEDEEDEPDRKPDPGNTVTLSGLLNFTDGLWSCCGEERIFVFTTNHKDRLDPALLRSGRMDFHILLSYCTFPAFKQLAFNYLGIHDHELYPLLEEAMKSGSQITPAEICELLISNKDSSHLALKSVIAAFDQARSVESLKDCEGGLSKQVEQPKDCERGLSEQQVEQQQTPDGKDWGGGLQRRKRIRQGWDGGVTEHEEQQRSKGRQKLRYLETARLNTLK